MASRAKRKKAFKAAREESYNKELAFIDSVLENLDQMNKDYCEGKLGRCAILCAKCETENWVQRSKEKRNLAIPENMDLECGNCGAIYCAKNRKYDWIKKG